MMLSPGSLLNGQGGTRFPLDIVTGAVGAYSTRKLRRAYAGSALRIRRSSDNAEQDIGFVNNVLDIASASTFIGAGSGFLSKWYDQSGNGNDMVQATAGNQPSYVASGINGKPAGRVTAATRTMATVAGATTGNQAHSILLVATRDGTAATPRMLASYGNTNALAAYSGLGYDVSGGNQVEELLSFGTTIPGTFVVDTSQHVWTKLYSPNTATGKLDGGNTFSGAWTANIGDTVLALFTATGANATAATISEAYFFSRSLSAADETLLNAAMKSYWATP